MGVFAPSTSTCTVSVSRAPGMRQTNPAANEFSVKPRSGRALTSLMGPELGGGAATRWREEEDGVVMLDKLIERSAALEDGYAVVGAVEDEVVDGEMEPVEKDQEMSSAGRFLFVTSSDTTGVTSSAGRGGESGADKA